MKGEQRMIRDTLLTILAAVSLLALGVGIYIAIDCVVEALR